MFSITGLIIGVHFLLAGILAWRLAIPLRERRIEPNRLYGVRLKEAFTSDEAWYAINEYGAERLIFWSRTVIIAGLLAIVLPLPSNSPWWIPIAFYPVVYVIGAIEAKRWGARWVAQHGGERENGSDVESV